MRLLLLMPFGKVFDPIEEAIRDSATAEGISSLRLDELSTGQIGSDTVRQIRDADIVVADFTSLNANVLLEIGVVQALNAKLIAIQEEPINLPILLKNQRVPSAKDMGTSAYLTINSFTRSACSA